MGELYVIKSSIQHYSVHTFQQYAAEIISSTCEAFRMNYSMKAVSDSVIIFSKKGLEVMYERSEMLYYNHKYATYVNTSTSRAGRGQPYCLSLHFRNLVSFGNNITIDIALWERMSNGQYHPTPIQLHVKACELFDKEPVLGKALKRQLNITCPFQAAEYHFKNVCLDLSHFHYFLPFAWTHQVSTQARLDTFGYITDTREHLYNISVYLKIIQKPTLRKTS